MRVIALTPLACLIAIAHCRIRAIDARRYSPWFAERMATRRLGLRPRATRARAVGAAKRIDLAKAVEAARRRAGPEPRSITAGHQHHRSGQTRRQDCGRSPIRNRQPHPPCSLREHDCRVERGGRRHYQAMRLSVQALNGAQPLRRVG